MENNQDEIVKMFRDGLADHKMPVSEGVWAGVQSSIAAGGASASSGMAMIKVASVAGVVSIATIGVVNEVQLLNIENRVAIEIIEAEQSPKAIIEESNAVAPKNEWVKSFKEVETQPNSSDGNILKTSVPKAASMDVENADWIVEEEYQSKEVHEIAAIKTEEIAADQSEQIKPSSHSELAQDYTESQSEDTQNEPERVRNNEGKIPEQEKSEAVCSIKLTHKANAFISADGDGTNDCFEIKSEESIVDFKILIWSQAGEQLFESNDPNFKWCGANRFGNLVENQTVCYYQIIAFDNSNIQYSAKNAKGSITVFR